MKTFMFIDDERMPSDVTWAEWRFYSFDGVYEGKEYYENVVILRNSHEVLKWVNWNGFPDAVSFDHDLGDDQPTGYDIIKSLVEFDMEVFGKLIKEHHKFYVHSKNPVGAKNIADYVENYRKHKGFS